MSSNSLHRCYFFGTFNPVHFGHLIMAETVRNQFGFQQVLFIPAFNPPHRQNDMEIAPFCHRLAMLHQACGTNPSFEVSDIESRREGPSYTIDTLKALIPGFGQHDEPVPLIIGADAIRKLHTWHQGEVLAKKALFLQAPRLTGAQVTHIHLYGQEMPLHTKAIDMPRIEISATLLRDRCRKNLSLRYLTPDSVIDYITWNHLYREEGEMG